MCGPEVFFRVFDDFLFRYNNVEEQLIQSATIILGGHVGLEIRTLVSLRGAACLTIKILTAELHVTHHQEINPSLTFEGH